MRTRSLVDDNPYLALVYGEVADGRDTPWCACTRVV